MVGTAGGTRASTFDYRITSLIVFSRGRAIGRILGIVFLPTLFFLSSVVSGSAAEKRIALVLGNAVYQNAEVLANPVNDANDMAQALKGVGFDVILGTDLTKAAMDEKVREFADALNGAKVALFFYSGHGLQYSGQNYLVPVDAKLTSSSALDFEMIRLDLIQRVMERGAEVNLIFLDACRDSPFGPTLARTMGTRSMAVAKGLVAVESGVGTLISFSTQPGNVALDGKGRNSPYAGPLARHIGTAGEDLTNILIDVRNEVMATTEDRQVPWENSSLRAKFYFTPPAPIVPLDVQVEQNFWSVVKDSESPAVLQTYLDRYPAGAFASVARALIEQRKQEAVAEQARLDAEKKRVEEAERAVEANRLQEVQKAAEREAAEAKRVEEQRKSDEAKWAAQLKSALDAVRTANDAAQAAEERSKTALHDSAEAKAATEMVKEAQAKAAAAEEQRQTAIKDAEDAKRKLEAAQAAQAAATAAANEEQRKAQSSDAEKVKQALAAAEASKRAVLQAEEQRQAAIKEAELAKQALEQAKMAQKAAAPTQVASLSRESGEAVAPTPIAKFAALSPVELAKDLEKELDRVGCKPGSLDGAWNDKSSSALDRFVKYTKVAIASDHPTPEALDIVSAQRVRICPLECAAGQVAVDDKCVAKPKEKRTTSDGRVSSISGGGSAGGGYQTCGRNGCQWVPKGCHAVPHSGGGGLGGRIFCN
jgi:uncharacterized caspase-like protein